MIYLVVVVIMVIVICINDGEVGVSGIVAGLANGIVVCIIIFICAYFAIDDVGYRVVEKDGGIVRIEKYMKNQKHCNMFFFGHDVLESDLQVLEHKED